MYVCVDVKQYFSTLYTVYGLRRLYSLVYVYIHCINSVFKPSCIYRPLMDVMMYFLYDFCLVNCLSILFISVCL